MHLFIFFLLVCVCVSEGLLHQSLYNNLYGKHFFLLLIFVCQFSNGYRERKCVTQNIDRIEKCNLNVGMVTQYWWINFCCTILAYSQWHVNVDSGQFNFLFYFLFFFCEKVIWEKSTKIGHQSPYVERIDFFNNLWWVPRLLNEHINDRNIK